MYDLILKNCSIIDVNSKGIHRGDISIKDGIIAETGDFRNQEGKDIIDLSGKFVAPGFIDFHIHVESSMLSPLEFSKEAIKHGTTTIMVDPHEIANVCSGRGIDLFLKQSDIVPLDMYIGIPSCVPATNLESSGGSITIKDIEELLPDKRIYGLAEMMNFPGIIHDLGDAREKVDLVYNAKKIVDGHCPGVRGKDLITYISNGKNDGTVRIMSDHETIDYEEAVEKVESGMYVGLRFGSATRDIERILPSLIKNNIDLDKFMLCSDDLDPIELLKEGHVNRIIKKTREIIMKNSDQNLEQATITAISMATLNPAAYLSKFLKLNQYPEIGEIKKGKKANLVVLDSLENLEVFHTIHNGELKVKNKIYTGEHINFDYKEFEGNVNIGKKVVPGDFAVRVSGEKETVEVKIIETVQNSIVTKEVIQPLKIYNNELSINREKDIVKIAVFERHHATGNFFTGFVKGLGIKKGAIASTIAHDSHNLIVAGTDDTSMAKAVNYLNEKDGGMVVVADEIDYFPLKICGLMSSASIDTVIKEFENIKKAVKRIGSDLESTFMTMAFLALPVIPKLRITDRGLVDVDKFEFVKLY